MPTFNRQNPSRLEDLFQETINITTKNMANIDHYHGQASKLTLASSHFASGLHQTASAKLYRTHFSATRTLALKRFWPKF